MTGRSGNGVRTGAQGGLLVREVEQETAPAQEAGPIESLDLGNGEPARGQAVDEPSSELPPLRRPLQERLRTGMRNLFGTRKQIVDDLLQCAPVGLYARMAEEVLDQEQSRSSAERESAPTR
jgi:hypothetical protein